jgi:beclin 1
VNKLYCASFDRGVALFAGGVRDFAVAAAAADERRLRRRRRRKGLGGEAVFSLPYEIEPSGERVAGLSLRLMLNKDARWSRALKYLLADLKCCAAWSARERARRFRGEEGEGEGDEEEEEEEEEEEAGTERAAAAAGPSA